LPGFDALEDRKQQVEVGLCTVEIVDQGVGVEE
jgi:hypothetical protein